MFQDISIAGSSLFLMLGGLTLLIIGTILVAKAYFNKISSKGLQEKYMNKEWDSPLSARSKYPDVDVLRHSGIFFKVGLVISLGVLIAAFSWTSYDPVVNIPDGAMEMEFDLEVEPPRSAEPPPPPPPPPPPVIEEVPEDVFIEEDEDLEFMDQSIDADTEIEGPKAETKTEAAAPPPPPPPPPAEEEYEEIFKVVEEMPRFPGCEELDLTMAEKKTCAERKMMEFLYSELTYPPIARENNITGTVIIQFVVTKDGYIKDAKVARDIGGQCGAEALRVVNKMNNLPDRWNPGKQRGRPVAVMFTLPVKFVLLGT